MTQFKWKIYSDVDIKMFVQYKVDL